MINWKDISDLHVIKKLEHIIQKWYGVEIIYVNQYCKIQNNIFDKNYQFKNHFLKVQMGTSHGHQFLEQDIEQVCEKLTESSESSFIFDTYFAPVKGIVSRVSIQGVFEGAVFIFPVLHDTVTKDEIAGVKQKLIESGSNEADAGLAVEKMSRFNKANLDNLKDLVDLVAEEIITFHEEISKREDRISDLNSELGSKYKFHSMIGKSKKMQLIYRLLEKISKSESTVLIQGENGTGKELVAKAVHYSSPRKDNVFLTLNCSAFNDNLLDSELFGHVKGAFTGAIKDKKGLFEAANGGTLFMDEIGDTSPTMQVKLLRVLQEGTFLPVGATASKKVNVRIIAATNKNLKEMISKNEFREDLYYRINVINVLLPPLRERQEDIQILSDHFLEERCAEMGVPTKQLTKKCLEKMLDYPWPGNVRELENEIERLVILAGDDKMISPDMLSARIKDHGDRMNHVEPTDSVSAFKPEGSLKDALEQLEVLMIGEGLKRCNFNKSKLAKELGISRAGLIMKVDKYDLDKRKKAAGE